jgi:hypothetical protein
MTNLYTTSRRLDLTDQRFLVNEIRWRSEHGEPNVSIARRMGIRSTAISCIVRNLSWRE